MLQTRQRAYCKKKNSTIHTRLKNIFSVEIIVPKNILALITKPSKLPPLHRQNCFFHCDKGISCGEGPKRSLTNLCYLSLYLSLSLPPSLSRLEDRDLKFHWKGGESVARSKRGGGMKMEKFERNERREREKKENKKKYRDETSRK